MFVVQVRMAALPQRLTARRILSFCLFCIASLLFFPSAFSQDFPNKPLRIVLAYETGGSVDFLARTVANKLSERLGQPVLVEAKPGANERIASQHLLMSPADGYTMLLVAVPHATNPALFANIPYDTRRDFQPLIHLTNLPPVLLVRATSDIKTLDDLVKKAKAEPGTISYGSPGVATGNHLMVELFQYVSGTSLIHVPHKGVAALTTAVVGGHVDVGSITMSPSILGYITSGRLRALAIGPSERAAVLADVPTFAEQGYKDAVVVTWFGLVMRAGTPAGIVNKLNHEINAVLAMPDVRERLASAGMSVVGGSSEQFTRHIHSEIDRWGKIIKERGIKVD
ncbi:MAG: tripartite tricarboxylate transporter substrate binding protein [Burkholderiales bacterium]|mgnify:CR=1 FL=1|nr:tripartite tricarboxylate transporter substrate binding protein [Burkholderiales bacterium]